MSQFLKPVTADQAKFVKSSCHTQWRHAAEWSRCDLCYWSDSRRCFTTCYRRGQFLDVCHQCGGDENLWKTLLQEGWTVSR